MAILGNGNESSRPILILDVFERATHKEQPQVNGLLGETPVERGFDDKKSNLRHRNPSFFPEMRRTKVTSGNVRQLRRWTCDVRRRR